MGISIVFFICDLVIGACSIFAAILLLPGFFRKFSNKCKKFWASIWALLLTEVIIVAIGFIVGITLGLIKEGYMFSYVSIAGSDIPILGHFVGGFNNFRTIPYYFNVLRFMGEGYIWLYIVDSFILGLVQLFIGVFEVIFFIRCLMERVKGANYHKIIPTYSIKKDYVSTMYDVKKAPYVSNLYNLKPQATGESYSTNKGTYAYKEQTAKTNVNVEINEKTVETLKKYKALLDCNAITKEEYDKVKRELLGI